LKIGMRARTWLLRTAVALCLGQGLVACASNEGSLETGGPGSDASPDAADGAVLPMPDAAAEGAVAEGGRADASRDSGAQDAPVEAPVDAPADSPQRDAGPVLPPYAPCPAGETPCVIMPVGDSITWGYQSTTGGGYRITLLEDIWAAGHAATFVGDNTSGPTTLDGKPFPRNNEGFSGYTIDDAPDIPASLGGPRTGIAPLVPAALTKYSPNIVTLMIGTNDMGTDNDVSNAPDRLAALLDSITTTRPEALLVLAQITPTGDSATNARIEAYNAAMPALVQARVSTGKHIVLVDMYSAFVADPSYLTDYMKDSLHPNDTGYALMGKTWFAAIGPVL
jgi:lysophospholipase L1-like esterase